MIQIKQRDTGIGLVANLSNDGGALNLSGASVIFMFSRHRINANVLNSDTGRVMVVLNEVHTSNAGVFNAEFRVTFEDGRIETFPNDGYMKINIMSNLGG